MSDDQMLFLTTNFWIAIAIFAPFPIGTVIAMAWVVILVGYQLDCEKQNKTPKL